MTERDPNRPTAPPAGAQPGPEEAPTVAWRPPPNGGVEDATPTPAEPVRRPQRGSRVRWAVALLVTALVVAVGAAAAILLTGQTAPSPLVGYASPGSVVYGEVRLDLPGDQRTELGQFLSKFPGFADQSTLDAKIDDVLDRVVRAATEDRQTWTTDIQPWFGGQLGFSVGAMPTAERPEDARFLLILGVTDAERARAWFDQVTADVETTPGEQDGMQLSLFGADGVTGAMGIHDERVMLVGDEASVREAIAGDGNGELESNEQFGQAQAAIEGDSLGFVYVDLQAYTGWAMDLSESIGASVPFAELSRELTPEWMMFRAQARGDSLAFEAVGPHPELTAADENRAGSLAGHVPPSTFFLADAHDAGASIRELSARLRQEPEAAEVFEQLDQVLSFVGGEEGLVGWMGDAGVALARDGDGIHGGLIFRPTDRARAENLLTNLRNLASLGGASMGLTVRDEDHAGTPVTIIDVGDWRDLAGAAAGSAMPGTDLPEGRLEIAYAVTDDVVVLGIGPSFVRASLDAGSSDSLADDDRYRNLLEQVGAENTASLWLDMVAVRELVEQLGTTDPEGFAAYERDVKPYLLPIDSIIQATVRDGDLDRTTFLVTVR